MQFNQRELEFLYCFILFVNRLTKKIFHIYITLKIIDAIKYNQNILNASFKKIMDNQKSNEQKKQKDKTKVIFFALRIASNHTMCQMSEKHAIK